MLTQDDRAILKQLDDIEQQIRQLEAQQAVIELPLVDKVLKEGDRITMVQLASRLPPGSGKLRLNTAIRNQPAMSLAAET